MFHVPNKYRVRNGPMASDDTYGNNGMFLIPTKKPRTHNPRPMTVIASDGMGWEHVSVSLPTRCPEWLEMCGIKGRFWDDGDLVIQFHPVAAEYVDCHPNCLHLWRKEGTNDFVEIPPSILVGPK